MEKIPRTIHWCWLSGEPIPQSLQQCMESWKRWLPDYRIKCWTQENFDIHSSPWIEEAVKLRKWAFAADYIRLYALYTEGGIYLDSDVEVFRPLDKMLQYDFFSASEFPFARYKDDGVPVDQQGAPLDRDAFVKDFGLQAAIMGSTAKNPYIKECLSFYQQRHFCQEDGTLATHFIMPLVIAKVAENYGFHYTGRQQMLQGLPGRYFIGDIYLLPSCRRLLRPQSLAFHHCAGSWLTTPNSTPELIGDKLLTLGIKLTAKAIWRRWKRWKKRHF